MQTRDWQDLGHHGCLAYNPGLADGLTERLAVHHGCLLCKGFGGSLHYSCTVVIHFDEVIHGCVVGGAQLDADAEGELVAVVSQRVRDLPLATQLSVLLVVGRYGTYAAGSRVRSLASSTAFSQSTRRCERRG